MSRPANAGRFDLADILRDHRAELEKLQHLRPAQKRVLTDVAQCRTEVLGGHLDRCEDCDWEQPSYNSCRNRHCPKCQALAQEKWIEARRAQMLDVRHFHVVFTLPSELRPLAQWAPQVVFGALFSASKDTLMELGVSRLDATLGATLVLHTWTRALHFHPHVHAIVTAGGLADDGTWSPSSPRFLFPVWMMSKLFRGKMMTALGDAYRRGAFDGFDAFDDPQGFQLLMRKVAPLSWNVYAKAPFKKGKHVLDYLGRYTHRVGLANSRILAYSPGVVSFRTKGTGVETVTPVEFLGRFVQHVLPQGFHKIRHIGLYASAAEKKRDAARKILNLPHSEPTKVDWKKKLALLTGRDVDVCPRCAGHVVHLPLPRSRDPPAAAA